MDLRAYLLGTEVYTILGADPESCLNRLNEKGIPIHNVKRTDDFSLTFTVPGGHRRDILRCCDRTYCQGQCVQKIGLKQELKKCLRRPFLILSVLFAVLFTFLMESVLWKIQIEGESEEAERRILYTLRDQGVDIFRKTRTMDTEALRYALLDEVSELSWVAVNLRGGKLTVLALESEPKEEGDMVAPGHLIAHRDGVITESVVLEGMPLVKVGDSVVEGQILVSGFEDYGIYMKGVCAQGEIHGQTWYRGTVITPSVRGIKEFTGRAWQEIYIIFGRKSINLSGSSSNLGVTCDKIVSTKQLSPSDYPLPLYLQRVIYREYRIREAPMPREDAQDLLCRSWESCLLSSMVAGRIESTDQVCFEEGGLYILQGESICHELLSRPMAMEPPQKGADPIGTDH